MMHQTSPGQDNISLDVTGCSTVQSDRGFDCTRQDQMLNIRVMQTTTAGNKDTNKY